VTASIELEAGEDEGQWRLCGDGKLVLGLLRPQSILGGLARQWRKRGATEQGATDADT
jgi:hypothetical protein